MNGRPVKELGIRIDPTADRVEVDGKQVRAEGKSYILLHKPRGYLSDRDERQEKPSALDLVPTGERLYAAGRLDWNSEGLLLLTNDGELAHRITHPRYEHDKEYLALVEGTPSNRALVQMRSGVVYEGTRLKVDSVEPVRNLGALARIHNWQEAGGNATWLRVTLHEGKKREIRRICSSIGHPVKRLIRVRIGPMRLGNLKVGEWRRLDGRQLEALKETTLRKT